MRFIDFYEKCKNGVRFQDDWNMLREFYNTTCGEVLTSLTISDELHDRFGKCRDMLLLSSKKDYCFKCGLPRCNKSGARVMSGVEVWYNILEVVFFILIFMLLGKLTWFIVALSLIAIEMGVIGMCNVHMSFLLARVVTIWREKGRMERDILWRDAILALSDDNNLRKILSGLSGVFGCLVTEFVWERRIYQNSEEVLDVR